MSDIVCGDCGSPCPSTKGCPKCWGPVFDLATEAGRAAARDYGELQGEVAQTSTKAGIYIPVCLLALALMAVCRCLGGWMFVAAEFGLAILAAASWALPDWSGQRARQKAAARIAAPQR